MTGDGNDILAGGAGNDTLVGGAGKDTFEYDSPNDGSDAIFDFQVGDTNIGNTSTYNADSDVLDLAALLTYDPNNLTHDIDDFITLVDNSINDPTNTSSTLKIYADGNTSVADVTIHLADVTGTDLTTMITNGNIVLF